MTVHEMRMQIATMALNSDTMEELNKIHSSLGGRRHLDTKDDIDVLKDRICGRCDDISDEAIRIAWGKLTGKLVATQGPPKKLFRVYNGWVGDCNCHKVVEAVDEADAIRKATAADQLPRAFTATEITIVDGVETEYYSG